jgi:hypothetical protein
MGGYGIFGLKDGKTRPVYWMNLPGRNLVLRLFGDMDEWKEFERATVVSCSEGGCFVMDPTRLVALCKDAVAYLGEHPGWSSGRSKLPADLSDLEVAKYYLADLIGLAEATPRFLIFYDNFVVHKCAWPKRFSRIPARSEMIDDLAWGGQKESYD